MHDVKLAIGVINMATSNCDSTIFLKKRAWAMRPRAVEGCLVVHNLTSPYLYLRSFAVHAKTIFTR